MRNPLKPTCKDCGSQVDWQHSDECMYQWTPIYTQFDGLRRDYYRALYENNLLRTDLSDGRVEEWLKEPWNTHHFIDMFKEVALAQSWLAGHAWGFQSVVTVGLYFAWLLG